jgi:nitroreductase
MDFFEAVRLRRSVRSYTDKSVEGKMLDAIVEAVRLAPTAANRQAFKVAFAKTEGRREELLRVYGKPWFVEPPLVAAVFADPGSAWVRSDGANYADVDAAIVMEHIVLAAAALGLGTCWVGNFDPKAANEVFGFGPEWRPVALSPLGYAKEYPPMRQRKGKEELAVFL